MYYLWYQTPSDRPQGLKLVIPVHFNCDHPAPHPRYTMQSSFNFTDLSTNFKDNTDNFGGMSVTLTGIWPP